MTLTFTKDTEQPSSSNLPWGLTEEAVNECSEVIKDWETRADTSYTDLIVLLYPILSKQHYIKNGEKLIKEAMGPISWAWRRLCAHRRLTPAMILDRGATPLTVEQHAMLNVWQADCVAVLRRTAVETTCGYRSSPTEHDVAEVLELCAAMKAKLKPLLGPKDAEALR